MIRTQTGEATAFKGLILDFAGVLTEPVGQAQRSWCLEQGLTESAWANALEDHPEGRDLYKALESGRMTQTEWNRRTAALLGLTEHHNLMGRVWHDVRPATKMIALARAARRDGYATALLSNSFGLDPYDPYQELGVWDLFDVTVISEHVGVAKPDPVIYQITLDRLGLPGPTCVFADDRHENLIPAAALGIATVHADGQDTTVAHLARLLNLPPDPA
ncbi:HAD-IA family hydrolase [Streptomyces sp. NPDC047072]|uniref:HAD-IA family hydrolase n=1 Tax=Streptomyces sp. NPDC047072 TaxID=3154809 RepID=UPI0033D91055